MRRAQFLFCLDLLLLLAMAFLQEPRRTSLAGHEWLGIAFAGLIVVHLLLNWRWIVAALTRVRASDSRRARISAALNTLLFVLMAIAVLSGLAISEVVLPLTGLASSGLAAWRGVHSFVAGSAVAVVGLHVALNWDWITRVVRKGILQRSDNDTATEIELAGDAE